MDDFCAGWYNNCCSLFSISAFCLVVLLFSFFLAILLTNSYSFASGRNKVSHYLTNDTIELDQIHLKTIEDFCVKREGWIVTQADKHEQSKTVFCSSYNTSQIDNSRQIKYLNPNESYHEVNQHLQPRNYSLPINSAGDRNVTSFYLVKGSAISMYICPEVSTIHNATFSIILLNDWEQVDRFLTNSPRFNRNSLVSNVSISTGLNCKNHSVYNTTKSSFVFTIIETFAPLKLASLDGYISQVFYNVTLLNITRPQNKLNKEMIPSKVYGEVGDTLICAAPNVTDDFVEVESYLNQHVSLLGLILVTFEFVLILVILVAVGVCFSIRCKCKQREGYHPIN